MFFGRSKEITKPVVTKTTAVNDISNNIINHKTNVSNTSSTGDILVEDFHSVKENQRFDPLTSTWSAQSLTIQDPKRYIIISIDVNYV